jgi:ACS family tartrate transporter-like MFS transporter
MELLADQVLRNELSIAVRTFGSDHGSSFVDEPSMAMLGVAGLHAELINYRVEITDLHGFAAAGVYGLLAPFWSMPNEFLSGFSAAAGIAFINSVGNIGGFVGPYVMGTISKQTGSFRGGLVVASISLFTSAMLILALRKRIAPETEPIVRAQGSPAVLATRDIGS